MGEPTDNDLLFRGWRSLAAWRAGMIWRDIDRRVWRWLWVRFPRLDQFADVMTIAWAGNLTCSAPGFRERWVTDENPFRDPQVRAQLGVNDG